MEARRTDLFISFKRWLLRATKKQKSYTRTESPNIPELNQHNSSWTLLAIKARKAQKATAN